MLQLWQLALSWPSPNARDMPPPHTCQQSCRHRSMPNHSMRQQKNNAQHWLSCSLAKNATFRWTCYGHTYAISIFCDQDSHQGEQRLRLDRFFILGLFRNWKAAFSYYLVLLQYSGKYTFKIIISRNFAAVHDDTSPRYQGQAAAG